MAKEEQLLRELQQQISDLRHQAELIKTVLVVKEPNTVHAAQAFDGLRKQVIAATTERRSHLVQLAQFAVSVSRATSVSDLEPQIDEWLRQAGLERVHSLPEGATVDELYEDVSGQGLDGAFEAVEPAYVDGQTGWIVRPGRARALPDEPSPNPDDTEDVTT